jgi:hypothetical protein
MERDMSRASDWLESTLLEDFQEDAEFIEGEDVNHVIVRWTVEDEAGRARRNAPFVIVINETVLTRWDGENERGQSIIETRVRQMIAARRQHYDETGPVVVPRAFVVQIDEGDL